MLQFEKHTNIIGKVESRSKTIRCSQVPTSGTQKCFESLVATPLPNTIHYTTTSVDSIPSFQSTAPNEVKRRRDEIKKKMKVAQAWI